ncbi:collagen alpha-1(XII) chain-like, partial [Saccostrea cucullata]|uniref:collagen alpha-1(XII) chain-like n=1 Tax=Saccostrea cuccullata TaxID=36930 RepID=UPI002ED1BE6F
MAEESVLLNLAVYNMAMKPAFYSSILTDLSSLDGMDEYPDPINLTITETFDNGVRLNWTMPSTCYEMSTVVVEFRSSNDRVHVLHVEPYNDWLDLTDLDPETSYNMSFVTEYGTQRSDPVFLQFRTSASKNGVVAYAQAKELL